MMIKFRTIIKKSKKKSKEKKNIYIYVLNCLITLGHDTLAIEQNFFLCPWPWSRN